MLRTLASKRAFEELEASYIGVAWKQNSSNTSASAIFVSPIAAVKGKSPSYSMSWSPVHAMGQSTGADPGGNLTVAN